MEKENLSKLGKYGLMAMDYLKENHYQRYKSLVRFGRLTEVLEPVNREAYQMIDTMMEKYLKNHKPENPADTMEMYKIRQQGMMQAEEIVIHEIVNQYH
nr:TnpV protein [Hominisplanchenecus murintestinalis]